MNGFRPVIECKEEENARQQIKPQGMHKTNAMPGEKVIRQLPRTNKKEAEGSKKFGVPVKKLIEKIDNDIPKGATIIDRRLSALRAPVSGQWRAAILAMRERRARWAFPAQQPHLSQRRSSHDRGGR